MSAPFQPGLALNNQEKWLFMAKEVYRLGGFVPKVALDAFQAKEIDLNSREFMNPKAEKIVFNKKSYRDWEQLKNAKIPNYGSITENLEETEKEIDILLEFGCIKEEKEFDDDSIISPIHFIKNRQADGSYKNRLVFHDKKNYRYWGFFVCGKFQFFNVFQMKFFHFQLPKTSKFLFFLY